MAESIQLTFIEPCSSMSLTTFWGPLPDIVCTGNRNGHHTPQRTNVNLPVKWMLSA